MPVISEITSHFRTLSLKAPWNWVMKSHQKPRCRFSGVSWGSEFMRAPIGQPAFVGGKSQRLGLGAVGLVFDESIKARVIWRIEV